MQLFLECLPCLLRQVLEAARMATSDVDVQSDIMDEAVRLLAGYRSYSCAPMICEAMHKIVKEQSGVEDPYAQIKERDIGQALKLEPLLKDFALREGDALRLALKVAATGNIMDSALYQNLDIAACLKAELEKPFAISDLEDFKDEIEGAGQILIIGDNAGEVVFDKILAEYLAPEHQIIFAVRDAAIINDATVGDARRAGMQHYAGIISTGCRAPGAIYELCSPEFQDVFDKADVVISKGQGNYEALSDPSRQVYFLLKAKCPRIAQTLNVAVNEYVFKRIGG